MLKPLKERNWMNKVVIFCYLEVIRLLFEGWSVISSAKKEKNEKKEEKGN